MKNSPIYGIVTMAAQIGSSMPISLIPRQRMERCFGDLWEAAFRHHPFDSVCTLLRVSGLQDAGWDPFEESEAAFDDFNCYLRAKVDGLSPKAQWRIGLLMYCQCVEMSAIHSTLANLLRVVLGERYHLNPLGSLGRPDKKRIYKWYPPSAKAKWRKLRDLATKANLSELGELIDSFYNDDVRNAFSHSDYVITEAQFRWTEGGIPSELPLEHINALITNAFNFVGGFMGMRELWLTLAGEMARYHKWPQYEVLELVCDPKKRLTGFRVHFSNGTSARFVRGAEGVDATNLSFERDGTVNFFVGLRNALRPVWMIDGQVVDFGDKKALREIKK